MLEFGVIPFAACTVGLVLVVWEFASQFSLGFWVILVAFNDVFYPLLLSGLRLLWVLGLLKLHTGPGRKL